ncbi:hypothetical protein [Nodosilinea sp. FACHB-13]|uniref:hypothetical protein n=1 Tax=Cyanophyceae TaxID=3028117 RepID=UPI001681C834|nr:hypothetical protein [Nodosilinea sp. FACHB-13]MBD2106487.1 hypothetical protein [Nodosilinea sp. FACHB-13]
MTLSIKLSEALGCDRHNNDSQLSNNSFTKNAAAPIIKTTVAEISNAKAKYTT